MLDVCVACVLLIKTVLFFPIIFIQTFVFKLRERKPTQYLTSDIMHCFDYDQYVNKICVQETLLRAVEHLGEA